MIKQSQNESVFSAILSSQDVERLTGFKSPGKQREFLQSRGYPFVLNAKNEPVVSSLYVAQSLGFNMAKKTEPKKPNWDKLGEV